MTDRSSNAIHSLSLVSKLASSNHIESQSAGHPAGIRQRNFNAKPKSDPELLKGRLDNFIGGRYAGQNLSSLLYHARSSSDASIKMTCFHAPSMSKPTFGDALSRFLSSSTSGLQLEPCGMGTTFGPTWTNHWVRVEMSFSPDWAQYDQVELHFDPGCEGLVFAEDGRCLQGLTGTEHGDEPVRRIEHIISPAELTIAEIVAPNMQALALKYDFMLLRELALELPAQSVLGNLSLTTANDIMDAFDGSTGCIPKLRRIAERVMGKDWELEFNNSYTKSVDTTTETGKLWALGHCHIDTAWLWPWSATQQKVARSWSTQVDLMDRYPEFVFGATSAQQYKWLEELYPDVFERVRDKVHENKWEIIGGTWLEMDGNMPSGESFCRQFLLGQKYFLSRFGKRADIFVLPDTFGYSAQLPQLARSSGCHAFFTQKLSWNATNKFPHTTFNWIGLDGTEILTHMTPVLTYNSDVSVENVRRAHHNHASLQVTSEAMLLYGDGDGGGGPKSHMIERVRRLKATGQKHDPTGVEVPLVRLGGSMSDFFAKVRQETGDGRFLPDWFGELYLEFHRGTYTSQASTKKGNRDCEVLLRSLELFATLASISTSYSYPKAELEDMWELLCKNHFHDTLPGSSIELCVEDSDARYEEIARRAHALRDETLQALCSNIGQRVAQATLFQQVIPVNHAHWIDRKEVINIGDQQALVTIPRGSLIGRVDSDVAALGDVGAVSITEENGGLTLSNHSISITVRNGRIISLFDVQLGRELILEGQTGGFALFVDQPANWDAWDVEYYHLQQKTELLLQSPHISISSALRGVLTYTLPLANSTCTVQISLDAVPAPGSSTDPRSLIRFDLDVDWKEDHRFLKFELPTSLWSHEATYDIAFGTVKRPTHRNTSWDAARFEVCGHKFADLSEFGHGVAMITESKYGFAVQGSTMRLSLLRSPTAPDANCDRRKHAFSFGVYPHAGTFNESEVPGVATAFNNPLILYSGETLPVEPSPSLQRFPIYLEGGRNVTLETIKRGEGDWTGDREGYKPTGQRTVVCRLFEHLGGRGDVQLHFRDPTLTKVELVNILEDQIDELALIDSDIGSKMVRLVFKAFEVKTIRLWLA
ncbi:glycoside hydrolase family 38 protein [Naematelia encephala]|uniref:Alpha-mannosidase n=1 Tax=Naematelia encephala TaxID=71784 RepID=A0A1Y2AW18_9TREE|nr:glycoside hydrolase family 38 protein [Naematelia encephala]